MKTYQDLLAVGDDELKRGAFCEDAVNAFIASPMYKEAWAAERYFAHHNITIEKLVKYLYTVTGRQVEDPFSANHKTKWGIFPKLVVQESMYILANGLKLQDLNNKKKLGKDIDRKLIYAAIRALVNGVSFGFWNLDHLEVFSLADTPTEPGFCPLYDDDTSQLKGGIRFWSRRIGDEVNHYYTLYDVDGYAEYAKVGSEEIRVSAEKTAYKITVNLTEAGGVESITGENYGVLPIVPLYGNMTHQSEIVGYRDDIDTYDLIKNGFFNDIDDNGVFWSIKNAGGMDDVDLAWFMQRIKTIKAAIVEDEGEATPNTVSLPTEAIQTALDIIRHDVYENAQMLDLDRLSAGQKTAQELRTAYQPMDNKCALFEAEILSFLDGIFALAGIPEEEASFTWNKVVNETEETSMVLSAANYLSDESVIQHLPFLTPEEMAAEIEKRIQGDYQQFNAEE